MGADQKDQILVGQRRIFSDKDDPRNGDTVRIIEDMGAILRVSFSDGDDGVVNRDQIGHVVG